VRVYSILIGAAPTADSREQPWWPQLQEISMVPPASLQYCCNNCHLQVRSSCKAGWAHFFVFAITALCN